MYAMVEVNCLHKNNDTAKNSELCHFHVVKQYSDSGWAYLWKLQNVSLWTAVITLIQRRGFLVSHLLWHGALLFYGAIQRNSLFSCIFDNAWSILTRIAMETKIVYKIRSYHFFRIFSWSDRVFLLTDCFWWK